ncbi:MAG: hypothetical protein A2Z83_06565 [Omnitrophica bacterium GWA2_52_8]|nr:MAG: hypothetical protein A2Z83_06565 [Omnitrophica bacterium GWA2_52_8]
MIFASCHSRVFLSGISAGGGSATKFGGQNQWQIPAYPPPVDKRGQDIKRLMHCYLVRFSHRLGESIRKPLWTHGVASKVLRPRFNRAQKTTPVVQMKKPICTTASARAFLIGDEKCGLVLCFIDFYASEHRAVLVTFLKVILNV